MVDPLRKLPLALTESSHPATLWSAKPGGRVQCHLSPRECNIPSGGVGFCGVRRNVGGKLLTMNYGKSVAMTQESIEVEAVFHYAPGERILSLGNIGCMMACDFCHNWQTSQARLARDQDIHAYTSEEIVEYALRHDIKILSWTYNDPVVWHEFVVDTAKLARKHGLKNLYKSAFYIGPEAVDELLEVIDIFSISLKSMDPEFYRKHTKGRLQPVLDAIKQVHAADGDGSKPHLELSNLCVTGRNDNIEATTTMARWILENLDADIPLHFVRFHPDFKYTNVERTSIEFLQQARHSAKALGLRHVYLGNVLDATSGNTTCAQCNEVLALRQGTTLTSLASAIHCPSCGASGPITFPWGTTHSTQPAALPEGDQSAVYSFTKSVSALHVEQATEISISYQFLGNNGQSLGDPQSSRCLRFLISKAHPEAESVRIYYPSNHKPIVLEVLDRAHFPTREVSSNGEIR